MESERSEFLAIRLIASCPGEHFAYAPTSFEVACKGRQEIFTMKRDFRKINEKIDEIYRRRFKQTFIDNGLECWPFFESYYWPHMAFAFDALELLEKLFTNFKFSVMSIAFIPGDPRNEVWEKVLRSFVNEKRISLRISSYENKSSLWSRAKDSWSVSFLRDYKFHFFERLKVRRALGSPNYSKLKDYKDSIIFLTLASHWSAVEKKPFKFDNQISRIVSAVKAKRDVGVTVIECPYGVIDDTYKRICERSKEVGTDLALHLFQACQLWNIDAIRRYIRSFLVSRQLNTCRVPEQSNVAILAVIKGFIADFCRIQLPQILLYDALASRLLDTLRPRLVVATYETGPVARSFLISACNRRITTVGLMHGMIFDTHYDYMHSCVTPGQEFRGHGFIVPDLTLVWGEYWRSILTEKGCYPKSAVAVTGNWRMDNLKAPMLIPDKKLHKKKVLVCTSGHEVAVYLRLVMSVLQRHDVTLLTIRPHPSDDILLVREVITDFLDIGFDLVLSTGSLYSELAEADLLITQMSTIALEATLFGTATIVVNLNGYLTGWDEFKANPAWLYCESESELQRFCDDFFTGALSESHQSTKVDSANRFFGALDGNAASRAANLILDQL